MERWRGRLEEAGFEGARHLAARHRCVGVQRCVPVWANGAIGVVDRLRLASRLAAQRLAVVAARAEALVQGERRQRAGNDGQAGLILDGRRTLAPRLGLGEVVCKSIETLLVLPAPRGEGGDIRSGGGAPWTNTRTRRSGKNIGPGAGEAPRPPPPPGPTQGPNLGAGDAAVSTTPRSRNPDPAERLVELAPTSLPRRRREPCKVAVLTDSARHDVGLLSVLRSARSIRRLHCARPRRPHPCWTLSAPTFRRANLPPRRSSGPRDSASALGLAGCLNVCYSPTIILPICSVVESLNVTRRLVTSGGPSAMAPRRAVW